MNKKYDMTSGDSCDRQQAGTNSASCEGSRESIAGKAVSGRQTTLADSIDITEGRARLDEACKSLLSEKAILSRILKHTVEGFEELDPDEIAEKYILGEPEVSRIPVMPGSARMDSCKDNNHEGSSSPSRVEASGAESIIPGEGKVMFDIRINVLLPEERNKDGSWIHIIVNVEAQNDFYPGYPFVRRGLFYCARMISAQYGTIFKNSEYDRIRHVYSIWIFMDPPAGRKNTVYRYGMEETCLYGDGRKMEPRRNYDLITMVMVCLGKGDVDRNNSLLGMLEVLFSNTIGKEEKKEILSRDYGLKMTEPVGRKEDNMCNYSEYVWNGGIKKGIEIGKNQGKGIGALGKIVNQILKKRDRGQAPDRIADDLLEEPTLVGRVLALASGRAFSDSVVNEIVETLLAEREAEVSPACV